MSYKKTTLPDYLDTVILQEVDFYKENTNLMTVFGNFLEELQFNIDYEESKSSGDYFGRVSQLYKKLNDDDFKLGNKQIDIINKNYYLEKYQSLFTKLKTSIEKLIDKGENIYFKNYSDDLGILIDSTCVMDTSISPFYDKFYEDQTVIPMSLPSTLYNKVTTDSKILQQTFSLMVDSLMKVNLNGLTTGNSDVYITETSHGTNLAVDYRYYERLFLYKETVRQSINVMLKGLGEYIYYIKTLNKRNDNADISKLIAFQIDIEDQAQQLDLLRNKLSTGAKMDTKSLSSYD
tara:strand:- start:789 stop:1661 length:873 start_codon:yes stop_codon:yes gene_type:complete